MKIIVCMKQVPAGTKVDIDPETGAMKRMSGDTRTNPYDLFALETAIYLLTLLTFPYFQGFPPLKILYMYPFPLFLPLWDNYKGKFIIQLFNRCLPLYQEVLRKSALLPL